MEYTILKPGEIISPRHSVREACKYYKHKPKLWIGMLVQKEHDAIHRDRGEEIQLFEDTFPIDRIFRNAYVDDKVFLWDLEKNMLSETHTVGVTEKPYWDNIVKQGGEVYINSFEQFDSLNLGLFRFRGTYKYSTLSIVESHKDNDESFFFRRISYNKLINS